jgi:hypothetical protein
MDLRAANSWPLRSPGILSRRAPCRFLLRGRQLLDQPSKPMRNPSHQLNAKKWSKGHARPGDRRPDGLLPHRFAAAQSRRRRQVPRDCGRKCRPLQPLAGEKCEEYFVLRPGLGMCPAAIFPVLPFLRHGAQIVSACPMPPIHPFKRRPSWPSRRWSLQPRCAASSQ